MTKTNTNYFLKFCVQGKFILGLNIFYNIKTNKNKRKESVEHMLSTSREAYLFLVASASFSACLYSCVIFLLLILLCAKKRTLGHIFIVNVIMLKYILKLKNRSCSVGSHWQKYHMKNYILLVWYQRRLFLQTPFYQYFRHLHTENQFIII